VFLPQGEPLGKALFKFGHGPGAQGIGTDFVQHERILHVQGVGKAICQPTDSAFYPTFPIWAAAPPLDSAGFREDALPTTLPAIYPFNPHSPKIHWSRYIAFPMNLAMSLIIGILSIATATMWFVAFALWFRSSAGRSVAGNFPVTGAG
jgi:hypothetical protein